MLLAAGTLDTVGRRSDDPRDKSINANRIIMPGIDVSFSSLEENVLG